MAIHPKRDDRQMACERCLLAANNKLSRHQMTNKQDYGGNMRVLVACEYSGRVRDAFIAAGHDAMSCDLLPTEAPGPHHQGDICDIIDNGWDLMIAHPPCTRLTNAGVRWLHIPPPGRTLAEMWVDLEKAAEFYKFLRDAKIAKKAIENPIMHRYARERINPGVRQIVQPWWFGERERV